MPDIPVHFCHVLHIDQVADIIVVEYVKDSDLHHVILLLRRRVNLFVGV